MKRVLLAIAVLLLLATSARAQNYAACQVNGIITVCPDNVRLKTGKTLIETYIPSLDASKIGSGTFAVARIPTAIPAINIGGGGVDNTEFGYLDGVTSAIQTQLNAKQPTLTLPLSIANGGTNSGTALSNNRAIVSSSGNIVETASACGVGTVLNGGSPPNCTATPTIGTSLTVPRIDSSGSLILNGATGGNVQLSVNSTTVLTAAAAGITAAQPLAMSSQKITGLAPATASGDALAYPWITSTYGASVLGATYTLSATNGTYSDTGLSVSLPSAGTYKVTADVRAEVLVSSGAGAFIECEFYNSTDAAAVSNSERIMAQANQVNVLSQGTWPINKIITVAASKTIKLYCSRNAGTTYTTSDIPSDANGRTEMSYVKISDT